MNSLVKSTSGGKSVMLPPSLSKYQGEINHEEPMEWVEAMRASD